MDSKKRVNHVRLLKHSVSMRKRREQQIYEKNVKMKAKAQMIMRLGRGLRLAKSRIGKNPSFAPAGAAAELPSAHRAAPAQTPAAASPEANV